MKEKYSFLKSAFSFFVLLGILFIPFPFHLLKVQLSVTDFIFGPLINFVSRIFPGKTVSDTRVYSDSYSMYILVLMLFVFSLVITAVLIRTRIWEKHKEAFFAIIFQVGSYYLALMLLKYGVDKIFKAQFYLPEPNTLYTPVGEVSKDLLYWSSMGTSHFYNVFLGCVEALAAVFLFFKRTRLIGLLMSTGILLNIIAVNFGFDISVKLYSLFLLFLTCYLLTPYLKSLRQFFLSLKAETGSIPVDNAPLLKNSFLSTFLRWLATGIIFLEVFYPYIRSGHLNDDLAGRPFLHGAYEVKQVISENDTLVAAYSPVKRFFIHRNGYMIFQDQEDHMQDYKLDYDTSRSIFILTDYRLRKAFLSYSFQPADSILVIQYFNNGKEYRLIGKSLNWKNLPALKRGFHWLMDEDD